MDLLLWADFIGISLVVSWREPKQSQPATDSTHTAKYESELFQKYFRQD
jgi:hypothetical protein